MKRDIYFEPGYDRRSKDPKKNYGIHGMQIRFVLSGEAGAVQFLLFTDWYPLRTQEEYFSHPPYSFFMPRPSAADLGYHSPVPRWEGQGEFECDLLPGGKCYYDGSTLNAEPIRDQFLEEGDEAVWAALENYYEEVFGVKE